MVSSLAGNLSTRTLVIFKLDPLGILPIEPIIDLVPGVTGNRITIDVIESESYSQSYDVTQNVLQDFSFATSNIRKAPRIYSVSGVMGSILQTGLVNIAPFGGVPTPDNARADQIRLQNLKNLADARQPVGVYTPRHAFPQCAITSIDAPWDPSVGKNTRITINFIELRIASPLSGTFIPDTALSTVANNQATGGGQQTAQSSQLQAGPNNPGFGNAPQFGGTPFA